MAGARAGAARGRGPRPGPARGGSWGAHGSGAPRPRAARLGGGDRDVPRRTLRRGPDPDAGADAPGARADRGCLRRLPSRGGGDLGGHRERARPRSGERLAPPAARGEAVPVLPRGGAARSVVPSEIWPGDRIRYRRADGRITPGASPWLKGVSDDRSAKVYSWRRQTREEIERPPAGASRGRLQDLSVAAGRVGADHGTESRGRKGSSVVRGFDVRRCSACGRASR
jgi:hypothetical protein